MVSNGKNNAQNISNSKQKLIITNGSELCKMIRSKLKLSQKEFGSSIGYSNPSVRISEIENGKVRLSNMARMSMINFYTTEVLINKLDNDYINI